jgi:hypothetical protein
MIKMKGVGGQCKTVWDYIVGRMGILESFDPMFSVSALLRIRKKGRGPGATTPRWSGQTTSIQPIFSVSALSQDEKKGRWSCCHYSPLVRTAIQWIPANIQCLSTFSGPEKRMGVLVSLLPVGQDRQLVIQPILSVSALSL